MVLLSMIVAGPVGCAGKAESPAPAATRYAPRIASTGQKTCFDSVGNVISCTGSGQDGELQIGAAWPHPRFIANPDTTVTDAMTGLAWAPSGNVLAARDPKWEKMGTAFDGAVTWQHAFHYVAKLNAERYLGHDDWRLPNFKELASLLNYGEANSAAWLNDQGFTRAQDMDYYWCSTSFPANAVYAWAIDLKFGYVHRFKKTHHHFVWPVRAGR
jgi:hypothetical protein